jgi:hypothetical protein
LESFFERWCDSKLWQWLSHISVARGTVVDRILLILFGESLQWSHYQSRRWYHLCQ